MQTHGNCSNFTKTRCPQYNEPAMCRLDNPIMGGNPALNNMTDDVKIAKKICEKCSSFKPR